MYYEALPNPNKVDRLSDFGPILYDLVHIESGVVTLGSSALRSVFESAHPGQRCSLLFRKNFMYMFDRHASLYITASWSPGHSRVVGNEVADTLAKGSKLPSVTKDSAYSHLKYRARMRAQLLQRKQ